jgi:hypothetical protein
MLKLRFVPLLLLLALPVVGQTTQTNPVDSIKGCLQNVDKLNYRVVADIQDPEAEKDPNPKRPVRYFHVVADQGPESYLNLVLITKQGKCVNPAPGNRAHLEYENFAPFEIAVELQTSHRKYLERLNDLSNLAEIDPDFANQGDVDIDEDVDLDSLFPCQPMAASFAESLKQAGGDTRNCPVLPKQRPVWDKQT